MATTETSTMAHDEHRESPPALADKNVLTMLDACSSGNIDTVKHMIAENPVSASLQDDETGQSPLMVAAAAGHGSICQLLLEAGAPWNAIDRKGQCAGNYATDAEQWEVVNLLVDAGTRAELILGASIRLQREIENSMEEATVVEDDGTTTEPSNDEKKFPEHEPCTKPDYLSRGVRYNSDKTALLDDDNDAVMMEWERPLMKAHASILMETPQRRVLNVGFGMGIVDTALQKLEPSLHIIIEAHPHVYEKMKQDGWDEKPNVRVCFGKWQDVVPQLVQEGVVVDGVFFDTYAESFMDLEDFHALLPKILSQPHGVYSFFNGLAPDNLFFHGVACQCVKLQLNHLGFDVDFLLCEIQVEDGVWEGVRRRYWHGRDTYYLPRVTWNADHLSEDKKAEVMSSYKRLLDDAMESGALPGKRLKTSPAEEK